MKILIFTDAWYPQVNGVVRTLDTVSGELRGQGHEVEVVSPDLFTGFPCPTYSEIRLAPFAGRRISRLISDHAPDAIHIATEGPVGLAARNVCVRENLPFTTSFHTKFPEYVYARFRFPVSWSYAFLRWFHGPAGAIMVATQSLHNELTDLGFRNLVNWSRGVDTALFQPYPDAGLEGEKPILLYCGRIAVEKSIEDFLKLDLPGTKYVVGGGPQLAELKRKYPGTVFTGYRTGEALARTVAGADVFVFPSRTDTFGLVLLEAMACGVPVAAYPVTGPLDVVADSGAGALHEDLGIAVAQALALSPEVCRQHALEYSWERSAGQFLANLHTIPRTATEMATA